MAGPHRLAKEEAEPRQELRQRVRMADNEVMDAFRKIIAARQKTDPTKKEKDQAWKTLKEREHPEAAGWVALTPAQAPS